MLQRCASKLRAPYGERCEVDLDHHRATIESNSSWFLTVICNAFLILKIELVTELGI